MRLFIILFLLILSSCSEERIAAKKGAWLISHDRLNELCLDTYGRSVDSIVVRDSIYNLDTLYIEGEIIRDTIKGKDTTIFIEHKCPPQKIIRDIIKKDSIIYKADPNQKAYYENQLRNKDKAIQDAQAAVNSANKKVEENRWWMLACLITWAFIAIFITIKVMKK